MNRVVQQQDAPGECPPAARYGRCAYKLDELLGQLIVGGKLETRPLRANDSSHIRLAQPRRRLDQRIEHRLQIEGRTTNDLQHVGSGGLLLERLAQLIK